MLLYATLSQICELYLLSLCSFTFCMYSALYLEYNSTLHRCIELRALLQKDEVEYLLAFDEEKCPLLD